MRLFTRDFVYVGAAVAEWLSSWLAEQEDRGSIPGLATWIFRDWLSPASKSRYGWNTAKSTKILKKPNQPNFVYIPGYNTLIHAMRVNMTQTDEANDIVSAIYTLQLCVFYLIHFKKGRWERYPDTPFPGTVH